MNKHGEDVMRWGVIPVQFAIWSYINDSVTLSKCMCMRASGAS